MEVLRDLLKVFISQTVDKNGIFRQIIAPLERTDVHNAHAETLSVSVLVEDAIIDCENTIGIRRQNAGKWISLFSFSFIYPFIYLFFYLLPHDERDFLKLTRSSFSFHPQLGSSTYFTCMKIP